MKMDEAARCLFERFESDGYLLLRGVMKDTKIREPLSINAEAIDAVKPNVYAESGAPIVASARKVVRDALGVHLQSLLMPTSKAACVGGSGGRVGDTRDGGKSQQLNGFTVEAASGSYIEGNKKYTDGTMWRQLF